MSDSAPIATLLAQLDASPTAHHVVGWWRKHLTNAGFSDCSLLGTLSAEKGFVCRGGAIIAWRIPEKSLHNGFRIVGAHSDSPGLHIKPQPNKQHANMSLLGVEVYGGPLLNSWLDRDLGIAGHVVLQDGSLHLFTSDTPVARISQLAIHLDRDVNDKGLVLDRHQHLNAMWLTSDGGQDFDQWLANTCGVNQSDIRASSAQLFDTQNASLIGADNSLIASARIDNQASCWAAMTALIEQSDTTSPSVVALFDHEEVGSSSATGAAGPLLEHVLERLCITEDLSRQDFINVLAKSHCVSADNAHAVHHNYPERHDSNHSPLINQGVVIKSNVGQRYATSATSIAPFIDACTRAKVPVQHFASRNNIACGSTIGPITATRLGIDTIDVGIPQLSMHSAREVCGSQDPIYLRDALRYYFAR
jgi:aspartyl aminopeptidase